MNIDELKELQLKIIKKDKLCNFISTVVILILFFISIIILIANNKSTYVIFLVCFFELILFLPIVYWVKNFVNEKDVQLFNKNFKNVFVLNALKNNFDDIVYSYKRGFDVDYVTKIGMFNTENKYYSNDFVSGKYRGIKFEQSDIQIEEKHEETEENGKIHTEWETFFKGKLIVFDFNKNFKANIKVSSKKFDALRIPILQDFAIVKMEDLDFNKRFYVYAQNEHEAFYILTPHFMEKIKEITKKINSEIMFCFADNRLYIAIDNNDDAFEYNVFKIIDEKSIEEKIIKDIKIIMDFVNELNLDSNVFGERV